MNGKLYLIPTIIAETTQDLVITPQLKNELPGIRHFLAENVRTARRFLSSLKIYESIETLHFDILDKDTKEETIETMLRPIIGGNNIGILSESGCPGVADPGALAVKVAHQLAIQVVPLVGPSSILLALMASGLNGQQFAFHGYLPIDSADALRSIRDFEKESRQKNQTQIFIETPYRNTGIFRNLINTLNAECLLTVALDITGPTEYIKTQRVKDWRKTAITLAKSPAVFLFLA